MTEFIRTIWQSANHKPSNTTDTKIKVEVVPPVSQIQIPVTPASMTLACGTLDNMVERQRLINVNLREHSKHPTATTTTTSAVNGRAQAQRAARRDVVNKRKASSPASSSVVESDDEDPLEDEEDEEDNQSKRIRTGRTSSISVVGGLATSERPVSSTLPTSGLLFTPDIDAAGEERIRAMEAQLETLDPDSKEAKKKRRLIRNRMSAQLHRERKKAYVGQLEDQLVEKDREVKMLQQQLAKMMQESEQLKSHWTETEKQTQLKLVEAEARAKAATEATARAAELAAQAAIVSKQTSVLDVVIKEEMSSWDTPWPVEDHSMTDSLDFSGLDVTPMTDLGTDNFLLGALDNPFAAFEEPTKPHVEMHAAKKNVAMMMAVMFSVGFFGNSSSFYNAATKSDFSSAFEANQPLSQMSIASRIVASLEQTSWKDFRDISSWIAAQTGSTEVKEEEEVPLVASPSAASDITDSCTSPAMEPSELNMDGIDGFEYPVDDSSFAFVVSEEPWLNTSCIKEENALLGDVTTTRASLTTRLYETLSTLWKEKNQVLLTVFNHRQEVTQRTLADMSLLQKGLASGDFFCQLRSEDDRLESKEQSVTFLYPMSALTSTGETVGGQETWCHSRNGTDDPVFLEVSCHMNSGKSRSVTMPM